VRPGVGRTSTASVSLSLSQSQSQSSSLSGSTRSRLPSDPVTIALHPHVHANSTDLGIGFSQNEVESILELKRRHPSMGRVIALITAPSVIRAILTCLALDLDLPSRTR
jgi:hypothetical protein